VAKAGEPRVTIRLSVAEHAVLVAAAGSAGVAVGSLVREAAVRYAAELAGDASAGRVRLRRAASAAPVVPARSLVPASVQALERQRRVNALGKKR
jgi:uncharacterized protein (DUF1778 family)